eukprot:TRINITY_DN45212_c0_g1_i2.p1 TRINITY_DN45212_c0_g1~~TRINITY_DN45212_c0_g1_i2.p1  ORF type:complete len:184 (-),score=22.54 TRINITY_DN45212_c0_g1_i2:42-593(-)
MQMFERHLKTATAGYGCAASEVMKPTKISYMRVSFPTLSPDESRDRSVELARVSQTEAPQRPWISDRSDESSVSEASSEAKPRAASKIRERGSVGAKGLSCGPQAGADDLPSMQQDSNDFDEEESFCDGPPKLPKSSRRLHAALMAQDEFQGKLANGFACSIALALSGLYRIDAQPPIRFEPE